MKFNVSVKELLRVLKATGSVIQKKNSLPILADHFFTMTDGKFFITASSSENTLTMPVDIFLDSDSQFEPFCVQSDDLIGLLSKLVEQPVTIVTDMDKKVMTVTYSTGLVSMPLDGCDEYPKVAKMTDPTTEFDIESKIFFPAVLAARSCTNPDDALRPVFSCVCLDVKDDGVVFVATNGHKLYKYAHVHGSPFLNGEEKKILIPNGVIGALAQPFAGMDVLTVSYDGKHVCLKSGDVSFTIRDLEQNYPNYNSVIPQECPYHAVLPVAGFLGALRRVQLMASTSSNMVKMAKQGMFLNISTSDTDFSKDANENLVLAEVDDPCTIPDGFQIGFKCAYMCDLLGNLSTENVRLEFISESRPVVVKEDAPNSVLTELTMPMQLQ